MTSLLNSLQDIPQLKYSGYLWMSDSKEPIILQSEVLPEHGTNSLNPFVIEGLLFAETENISITIRHTGRYVIAQTDLKQENSDSVSKYYLSHKLDKVTMVNFKQIWKAIPDTLCAGMEVLTLESIVFCGFSENKNK